MPFWQKTTFAPAFLTWSTMRRSMFSSSWRKALSWLGSLISIFASISVFLTSSAASRSAIFGSATRAGIPEWTFSLSTMTPSMSWVSAIAPPCFLISWMLSRSTKWPRSVFSATAVTARTAMSPRRSRLNETDFEAIAVNAMRLRVSWSSILTGFAIESRTSSAFCAARR